MPSDMPTLDDPLAHEIDFDSLPFSGDEAKAVKARLRELHKRSRNKTHRLFGTSWRGIRDAARDAEIGIKLSDEQRPKQRLRQKLTRLKRVPGSRLPKDKELLRALLHAAQYLELVPDTFDPLSLSPSEMKEKLAKLIAPEVEACVEALQSNPIIFANRGGRPRDRTLDSYLLELARIFQRITGKKLGFSRTRTSGYTPSGAGLLFLRTCLAPLERQMGKKLTDESIAHALLSARRQRKLS